MQNDIPYQADITSENHQKKIYCSILETKFKIMYANLLVSKYTRMTKNYRMSYGKLKLQREN